MAKITNEKYVTINPLSLVKDRTLPCDVFILLSVAGRIIIFRPKGSVADDPEKVKRMMKRGLQNLYIRETDVDAFNAYLQENPSPKPDAEGEAEPGSIVPASATDLAHADVSAVAPGVAGTNPSPLDQPAVVSIPVAPARGPSTPEARVAASEPAKAPEPDKAFVSDKPPEQLMAGLLVPAPDDAPAREEAKKMITDLLKASSANAAMAEIIENPDTEHATSVAIYTTLFAMGLNKNSQALLSDLIVASLLHDVGLTQV
ncbi:MAG: hypothetical protein HY075_16295, partial [Deltaproteobacteria bacterium]|nr:hypothetical protein [Deltaproteobacteria bacterium]